MSSFMLSNESIGSLAERIAEWEKKRGTDHGYLKEPAAIAQELYDLNAAGVRARYEDWNERGMIQPFEFISRHTPYGMIQFFKSLQCLRYQANEGRVPESEEYKRLEAIMLSVASAIVGALPAYEAAAWD